MITKELLDYIIYQLTHNQSWTTIEQELMTHGWAKEVLAEAYQKIANEHPELNLVVENQPKEEAAEVLTVENMSNVSADDVVFKSPVESSNNPVIGQAPTEALNMSAFPVESNQLEDQAQKGSGAYAIDGVEMKKDEKIAINVEKVNPEPRKAMGPVFEKEAVQAKDAGAVINPVNNIAQSTEKEKRSKSPVGLIILFFVLILFVGGGVFAYFNYLEPNRMAEKVMVKVGELKSADFSGKIKLGFEVPQEATDSLQDVGLDVVNVSILEEDGKVDVSFDIDGKFDFSKEGNYSMHADSSFLANKGEEGVAFKLGEKIFNNELYLSFSDIFPSGNYAIPSEISNYYGRWIRVVKNEDSKNEISNVLAKTISSLSLQDDLFSLKVKGVEQLEGNYCFKSAVAFDKEKLKRLLLLSLQSGESDEESLRYFNENYDEFFEDYLAKQEILIWTGVLDSNIYKIEALFTFDGDESQEKMTGSIIFTLKNHNNVFGVTPPDGYVEIEEVVLVGMSLLLKNMGPGDDFIDNEIRSAMEQARLIANKHKSDTGSFEGLNINMDMTRIIKDDVNTWGGKSADFASTKDAYCLSKDLVNETASWCIDSSDFIGKGICNIEKIKCENTSEDSVVEVQDPVVVEPPVIVEPIDPSDPYINKKTLIDELKTALDGQKKEKDTYLGVVSSSLGKDLVKKINQDEGINVISIHTSKEKYCAMKKFSDNNYYCIDSTGFVGDGRDCNKDYFVCSLEEVN